MVYSPKRGLNAGKVAVPEQHNKSTATKFTVGTPTPNWEIRMGRPSA